MEFAGLTLLLLYFGAVAMFVVWPLWAFWLAHRAVRNLNRTAAALEEIRDMLIAQQAERPPQSSVVDSILGR